ncbi:MAG: hypothetical protein ABI700_05850 [Chloroflexota bacterium]
MRVEYPLLPSVDALFINGTEYAEEISDALSDDERPGRAVIDPRDCKGSRFEIDAFQQAVDPQ